MEELDDDAALAVYADELQQRGDPQGELIALALAGLDVTEALAAHHDALWGDLALSTKPPRHARKLDRFAIEPRWHRGLLEYVRIDDIMLPIDDAYTRLRRRQIARHLRSLSIGWGRTEPAYRALFDAMLALGLPPRLRSLVVPDYTLGNPPDLGGLLAPVVATCSALEELWVSQGHHLGLLSSPSLVDLKITGATVEHVVELAGAELPALERLTLTGSRSLAVDRLRLTGLPALTTLYLQNCDPQGMFERIAEVAPRLASVSVYRTVLDHRAVQPILDAPHRFAHMRLTIPGGLFTRMLKDRLTVAIPQLTFTD